MKKVFLEISENSQENTCVRVSFLIKRLWHRCFPLNFAKFLGTPFLREQLWPLLLKHYLLFRNLVFWICYGGSLYLYHFQSNIGNEQVEFHL